jgi:hypothetical protein
MYFCNKLQRHIWVLGYFGGGSINFKMFEAAALDFAKKTGVPIETVSIDEILRSRRYKGFKFIWSDAEDQSPLVGSEVMDDVYTWLTD